MLVTAYKYINEHYIPADYLKFSDKIYQVVQVLLGELFELRHKTSHSVKASKNNIT